MSFRFSTLCLLWEQLSSLDAADKAETVIKHWFGQYISDLDRQEYGLALLSCLLPAQRYDRVYGLGEKQIIAIVVKAWGLGPSRQQELQKLQEERDVDCASAIMRVVTDFVGDQRLSKVSLTAEDVDNTLDLVAATCDFSSPDVRKQHHKVHGPPPSDLLAEMFRHMSAQEVKWAVRLLLKDLTPAVIPGISILSLIHPDLPRVLQVIHSLSGALAFIQGAGCRPGKELDVHGLGPSIQPQAGTIVGLPRFEKARSIAHGHRLMGDQEVSVERKHDGEYCQVHVWIEKDHPQWQVRVFSKSGRDSTDDRNSIIPPVRQCLGLGRSRCKVRQHCILVGELVVWNDDIQAIMPFYKIRRHVTREGRRLGCAEDLAPDPEERLMIVFHDVLLWDNRTCINETYTQRRQHLLGLVQPIAGRVEIETQIVMDFTFSDSVTRLARQMAFAVTQRWEGLVLKACQDPYIGSDGNLTQYVKLKKDYIPGLGDSADLIVIGARRDPLTAKSLGLMRGSWTTFFLACRETGGDCHDVEAPPSFRIVGLVSRPSISVPDIQYLNTHGRLSQMQFSRNCERLHVTTELRGKDLPTHLFSQPAVVEVVGAGFDRPANARYLTLRFPRIVKVHHDRSLDDAVNFAEYQRMAEASYGMAGHDDNEYRLWLAKLGYEHIDSESEAVTTPSTSQSQETESPDEDAQSIPTGQGKRRASVPLVPSGTSKRQKEASIDIENLNSTGAPGKDGPDVVEIPDSQADAELARTDTEQEVPEHDTEVAVSDNWPEHETVRRSTALLLSCHSGEPLSPGEYSGWQKVLVSHGLDITFDAERFWIGISRHSSSTENNLEGREVGHLVVVDPKVKSAAGTATSFVLSALEQHRSILSTCLPCRIVFVEWNAICRLGPNNGSLTNLWTTETTVCLTVANGTFSLTGTLR